MRERRKREEKEGGPGEEHLRELFVDDYDESYFYFQTFFFIFSQFNPLQRILGYIKHE